MSHPIETYALIFVVGALIGSFLNVVIYRTPVILLAGAEDEINEEPTIPATFGSRLKWTLNYFWEDFSYSVSYLFKDFWVESGAVLKGLSFPGSHCGNCQNSVAWYDNLPVISWFILAGRCRHCHEPYSFRYPLIEALTGLLFVYVFWLKGPSLDLFAWLFWAAALWAVFWIDVDTQFVFNVMTYPSIFLGILYNGSKGNLKWSLAGGLLAWCLFEAIALLSVLLLKKEGMGGGDVKLAMLLGVWLEPKLLMISLMLAFVTGSLAGLALVAIRRQSQPFPFGPFLVLGGLVALSVGDSLWAWYIDKSIW